MSEISDTGVDCIECVAWCEGDGVYMCVPGDQG